jgi:ribosome-associated heat shock protein Hsp15
MTEEDADADGLRLDKWLWQARFFKTRALAATLAARRKIRVNSTLITKPHYRVRPGDVLTFPQGHAVRVVRVIDLGIRRGPASEARTLYEDLAEP